MIGGRTCPVHCSVSVTLSGAIKSCEVRDANTIWAAATLIKESGEARATGVGGAVGCEAVGTTGPVASGLGGGTDLSFPRWLPQQAAR